MGWGASRPQIDPLADRPPHRCTPLGSEKNGRDPESIRAAETKGLDITVSAHTTSPQDATTDAGGLSPEEAGRRALYHFLARTLSRPIDKAEAGRIAPFADPGSELGRAVAAFREAVEAAAPEDLEREFHDLFIGVGRGELVPYASYYLTGFLNEKPLAELRRDMDALGFERADGVREPEDNIATLCDLMGHLIAGAASGEMDLYDQDRFFAAHLKPWAAKFFADLSSAKTADVYRRLGAVGQCFMAIEEDGFAMVARA